MAKTLGTGAAILNIRFQIGSNRSLTFDFGTIDLSGWVFELSVKQNKGARLKDISLTSPSGGISLPVYSSGSITASFSATNTNLTEGEYYWELRRTDLNVPLINGLAYFTYDAPDGDDSIPLEFTMGNQTINVTVSSTGGGGGSFATITGDPYDNANLTIALDDKENLGAAAAAQAAAQTYSDGKVEDTIVNGVTTKAPSQDAVFDALALKQDTLISAANIKTVNGSSVLGSGDLFVQSAADSDNPLGTIMSDDFNRADGAVGSNWTSVGAATYAIVSNKLRVTGGSSLVLNQYLYWNAYGTCNLDSWTATFKITVGTISATSFGIGINIIGTAAAGIISNQIVIALDTTNAGKISLYKQSATTGGITTSSGMTTVAGDVLDVKIRFIKHRLIVSVFNNTTKKTNALTFDYSSASGRSFGIPNAFRLGVGAIGGTHDVDDFLVVGNDPKSADYLVLGDSISGELTSNHPYSIWPEIINQVSSSKFFTNARSSIKIEEINTAEVLSLTPAKIIIALGINNIQVGDSVATVRTKMGTLVTTLTNSGYVLGTTLYINLITPSSTATNNTNIPLVNNDLITDYGTSGAIIDVHTPLLNGVALKYTSDGIHPSLEGHKIYAYAVINKLSLTINTKKMGDVFPLVYNGETQFVNIGDQNYSSFQPRYLLEVIGAVSPQIKVGTDTTDDGGWVQSAGAASLLLSSGLIWNGTNYVAKNAGPTIIIMNNTSGNGRITFAVSSGQTPGNNISGGFTRMFIDASTGINITDAVNFVLGTTSGNKFGTATTQKIGFWNATPIVQPTTAVAASTFVANTSAIANDTATFDGYTIGQVVKALRNTGLLA